MILHQPTLESERLILRPFSLADAPGVMALAGDARVSEYTLNIPHPYEEGMAEAWISTHAQAFYHRRDVILAVCLKAGGLAGAIGLHQDTRHGRAEMGYWIGVPHWGKGYCTEAAIALIGYAFKTLHLRKITCQHLAGNLASGRVMQKAGMACEGTLHAHYDKAGRFHDAVIYGLLNPKRLAE